MKIKKTISILLLIMLLAFILRVIVANNLHLNADETVYTTNALGFIDSGRISIFEQSPVYYYLFDLIYKMVGFSALKARLLSIIAGTLSVILIVVITKKFYNENIGLLAGFLFAISGFAIVHSTEMDMLMYFFMLLTMYFLIRSTSQEKNIDKFMILSMITYVIAVMIKPLAIPSIIPIGIYYLYKRRKQALKNHLQIVGIFLLISILMSLPVLSYNYILYTDRGVVDGVFSEYFGIEVPAYGGYGYDKGWRLSYFTSKFTGIFSSLAMKDFFLLLFGLLGLVISTTKHKNSINYLLIPAILTYSCFMGIHGGPNHYLILPIALSMYAAIGIRWLIARKDRLVPFVSSLPKRKFLVVFLLLIFIVNMAAIRIPLTEKAATNKLQEFFQSIDKENSLVIVDPNIYTGTAHFAFADHHFVIAGEFAEHITNFHKFPEHVVLPMYFVYCASGDCGWGKRNIHRESVQQSSQKFITDYFSEPVMTFSDQLPKGSYRYEIYTIDVNIPESYTSYIDRTHFFFSHSFKYLSDHEMFDYIDPDTLSGGKNVLYSYARVMLIIDSILAILLILYVGFWLSRKH